MEENNTEQLNIEQEQPADEVASLAENEAPIEPQPEATIENEQDLAEPVDLAQEQEPSKKPFDWKKFWKKFWQVSQWVLMGLLTLIIIVNVIKIIKGRASGEQISLVLGFGNANVVSPSMTPTINVGDMIYIHHQSDYAVGDIVTFLDPNQKIVVTHRIIAKENGLYTTKGDANNVSDTQLLTNENIYGKVFLTLHGFGNFIDFMQSIWGILIIIIIGLLLIEVPTLIVVIKEQREKKKLKEKIERLGGLTNRERKELNRINKEEAQKKAEKKNKTSAKNQGKKKR